MESSTEKRDWQNMHPRDAQRILDHTLTFGTTLDLEALLDEGMDVNQTDFAGRTALQMCSYQGKKDAVEMLLRRGANINLVCMYHDTLPLTALDAAEERKRKEIIDLLLQHGAKRGREIQPET